MPIEEVLFFVVIPLCALLTYSAVSAILERFQPPMTGLGYTAPAVLAVLAVCALELWCCAPGFFDARLTGCRC